MGQNERGDRNKTTKTTSEMRATSFVVGALGVGGKEYISGITRPLVSVLMDIRIEKNR